MAEKKIFFLKTLRLTRGLSFAGMQIDLRVPAKRSPRDAGAAQGTDVRGPACLTDEKTKTDEIPKKPASFGVKSPHYHPS